MRRGDVCLRKPSIGLHTQDKSEFPAKTSEGDLLQKIAIRPQQKREKIEFQIATEKIFFLPVTFLVRALPLDHLPHSNRWGLYYCLTPTCTTRGTHYFFSNIMTSASDIVYKDFVWILIPLLTL